MYIAPQPWRPAVEVRWQWESVLVPVRLSLVPVGKQGAPHIQKAGGGGGGWVWDEAQETVPVMTVENWEVAQDTAAISWV